MRYKLKFLTGSFVIGSVLSLGLVGSALAASKGTISGHITQNGHGVPSASITAICSSGSTTYGTIHPTISTPSTGYYSEQFTNCPNGAHVAVNAVSGSASGSSSGTMGSTSSQHLVLDVPLRNIALPEFGVLTALVALGGSGLLILQVRRRANSKA